MTYLHCTNCGVKSKRVFSTDIGREELLKVWNTRANSVTYPYFRRIKSLVLFPLISFCKFCDNYINERDRLLNLSDSIFDAVSDIKEFVKKCSINCPKKVNKI